MIITNVVKMDTQIQFKLMKEEKKRIKEEASKVGLGISPFCRSLILKQLNKEAINSQND